MVYTDTGRISGFVFLGLENYHGPGMRDLLDRLRFFGSQEDCAVIIARKLKSILVHIDFINLVSIK